LASIDGKGCDLIAVDTTQRAYHVPNKKFTIEPFRLEPVIGDTLVQIGVGLALESLKR